MNSSEVSVSFSTGAAIRLPAYKCGMTLSHNEHRNDYATVAEYVENNGLAEYFESPEEMQKAIDTDNLWVIQWYPDSPVGQCCIAAATLEGLKLDGTR
jgi:hypothetical protein